MTTELFSRLSDYDFRYLTQHLAIAGRSGDLNNLLALETSDHKNAWFVARDSRSEADGYVQDLQLARELVDISVEHSRGAQLAAAVGAQCRYALLNAALRDIAEHVSPRLSALRGEWAMDRGAGS
jgi:hypothetical protein